MKYPQCVKVGNQKYPINTDYKVSLKCLNIINDNTISDTERTLAVIYTLFGFIPKDEEISEFIRLSEMYLGCGETQVEHLERKKDMDFDYDFKYMVASFMSDYRINLVDEDMHWYQFVNLLQGLTEESILSRIRELRNYDLSEIKDQKQRSKIIEAQKSVELPEEITEEEQSAVDEFEALF